MRAVVVTNIPTPYRLPVYDLVDSEPDVDLHVMYMARSEPNRHWALPTPKAPSSFLRSRILPLRSRPVHVTTGLWRRLSALRPEVVVTNGFNPPQVLAFVYCVLHRVPHVAQTDGTPLSERGLGRLHRLARRIVSSRSVAFVAASDEGTQLMRQWGAPSGRPIFSSPLAVDNSAFAEDGREKDLDLLFSGQLSVVKDPLFAIEVAVAVARILGRVVVLGIIGDGPLREDVARRAAEVGASVDVLIGGFQQQDSLPTWYRRARVFLFPTRWDPWGLVLNEAMAAGVPSIASRAAGSARQLIEDGVSGYVREPDVEEWARLSADLLSDHRRAERLGDAGRRVIQSYSYAAAAGGIADALRAAVAPR